MLVSEREFKLEKYLNDGIESLVKDIIKTTVKNPKASMFFAKYANAAKKAESRRHSFENNGEHIPSFLITSITGKCNLNCAGCYNRANNAGNCDAEMTATQWSSVFSQAEQLGVAAVLLAGGEPMMRFDIIEEAANHPNILFPVFTNGTILSESAIKLFTNHRNLIPVLSLEGDEAVTDKRRGQGTYAKLKSTMEELSQRNLLFGASVTISADNLANTANGGFVSQLREKGCKAIVFVEYVPVDDSAPALNGAMRDVLAEKVTELRDNSGMIIISFPGDEKESGGCLAAGRGFFHINANGSAEPCPFSPYSDTNVKTSTLREALKSPLFVKLREGDFLLKEHTGGCTLFEQSGFVRSILAK
ncbi:MAG: radical SAM protein [Clostridiales bacterium]|jgi:MoaA/NifB/PqqE/SkfB family radical SAM enzyme|nr:radical SAM protein [Clostridiales bacterium]